MTAAWSRFLHMGTLGWLQDRDKHEDVTWHSCPYKNPTPGQELYQTPTSCDIYNLSVLRKPWRLRNLSLFLRLKKNLCQILTWNIDVLEQRNRQRTKLSFLDCFWDAYANFHETISLKNLSNENVWIQDTNMRETLLVGQKGVLLVKIPQQNFEESNKRHSAKPWWKCFASRK